MINRFRLAWRSWQKRRLNAAAMRYSIKTEAATRRFYERLHKMNSEIDDINAMGALVSLQFAARKAADVLESRSK
ncbi:MAG: hypothetical protein LBF61_12600 [Azoarcus sp.]|jgi:hypothetical protein|nr:hypothetical protein [Azoarcus sp.]